MFRRTLTVLACAAISAPALAQSSLPKCPDGLRYNQEPCSYLEWNASPPPRDRSPDLSIHNEPEGYDSPTGGGTTCLRCLRPTFNSLTVLSYAVEWVAGMSVGMNGNGTSITECEERARILRGRRAGT